jgi:hypothetical protein
MNATGDGWWRAEITLQGGDYRFRYLADGAFFPDYASNGIELGKTGWDSLLYVPRISRSKAIKDRLRRVA